MVAILRPHNAVQHFERWIGVELPLLIEQTIAEVGADSDFYIGGLSMGGYGAFRIGLTYADTYKGLSGHSSITDLAQMKDFVEEDWSSFDREKHKGGIADIVQGMTDWPPIRFDCGLADPLLEANRELHSFLEQRGVVHTYQEYSGGHEWVYWQEHLGETYRFFSALK